ncbi:MULTISPECIES: catabolite repressor/activator [Vibrio]|uniref:Autoinducer 2-binding periplasmic protein LuxP n=1 Tax=Vibrio algicola TaxID=2662262 RepID=A0A5Q0TGC2_9VIBR|nr:MULTISPECIES: catabolite repressor/activator [Vibrio]MBD1577479.1 catabolite repressor/activator [Vibrio sp. S11_S32]
MTLEQIAKLAGVSKTTASYVINGKATKYRISQKTQQKVMAVVEEHQYQPDHAAAALRAGNSRSFGLVIPDLENTSYARLAKLLESNSRLAGYQILIGCSGDDPKIEKDVVNALVSRRIDALFVASSMSDANEFYLTVQNKGTPVIALDRPLDDEHFSCVISEDFEGALNLTASVLFDDIQSIGLIGALPDLNISKERQLGFEAAVRQHANRSTLGSAINLSPVTMQLEYGAQFNAESGRKAIEKWLAQDAIPDAIITTSYTLLEGVLDVFFERPELMTKIKIATYGDNRLLDYLPIKINSLSQQFEIIADSALELALNASAKRYQSGVELVARKLKIRMK